MLRDFTIAATHPSVEEYAMKQQDKTGHDHPPVTAPSPQPFPSEEALQQKQKAETTEVAGRHKNDGQKDHKGAR